MMAAEGPFVAAIIARLVDPTFNLAAYGVAFAFALLVEAPVIMLMSASTALVDNATSFRRLRRFAFGLSALTTVALVGILTPPVYRFLALEIIALPEEVARLTYVSLWILLPWPGAIGYRRFYQGLLIRDGRTRLVALGTVGRLLTMGVAALLLYRWAGLPGAYVGAAALASGVAVEAILSRWMAGGSVRRLLDTPPPSESDPLSYPRILRFYYPLALTSVIGLAVQPMLTFFMGRAPSPVESLAVFPVVQALTFLFRSMGLAYQEVGIALMGRRFEHLPELRRFAVRLGFASATGLGLVALTPLSAVWYETVSGLAPDLARFAVLPTVILIPIPLLSALLSFQRGILVTAHVTRPITVATTIEVGLIAVGLPILSWGLGMVGVTAAVTAFLVGRLAAVGFLTPRCIRAVRREGEIPTREHL
jgi:hypothetical protein